ncbi:MAG: MlaD family protein [Bacteroidota bacterium]|nr:MlaD family protein [Bacteroidota bacterium]
MSNQERNNIRLGLFILSGIVVLMLAFYMIGVNHSLFGASFRVKARFSRLNGLTEGDNVLFSGIQAGTVKNIHIVDDSTIEAVLLINDNVKPFIHKNATVAIGSDGLMGNKVINIFQGQGASEKVQNGDLLSAKKTVDMDEMLLTFSKVDNNAEIITEQLKNTLTRVNESALFEMLNDKEMGLMLRSSLKNINSTTANASALTRYLSLMANDARHGKGTAGLLLNDTAFAAGLRATLIKMHQASDHAADLSYQLDQLAKHLNGDVDHGSGPVNALLRDSVMANNLRATLENIKNGTDGFNQNMNALKENFFFKGYFKRQAKKQKEEELKKAAPAPVQ